MDNQVRQTKGLTYQEVRKRLSIYGENEIKKVKDSSPIIILLRQIKKNTILYLLSISAIISLFIDKPITSLSILVVILIMVLIGFIQEYKAEQAIESLRKMLMPVTVVIRDGKKQQVPSKQLVPGDIVILGAGERIPADCRILSADGVRVDESVLTGESTEIPKYPQEKTTSSPSEKNSLYMGTFIVVGRCVAEVTHTGMNTRFGKIAGLISRAEKQLPLTDKINKIAKYMVVIAIFFSTATFMLMILRTPMINYTHITEVLIVAIALAVAAFPEGLPVVLVTTLATGASRMAAKNAIVNRMSIIETLGETTVICTDKTGTLTKGEMTVRQIITPKEIIRVTGTGLVGQGVFSNQQGQKINPQEDKHLSLLIKAAVVCTDAQIERTGEDMRFKLIGSPTEGALLIMGAKADIFREELKTKRLKTIPFSSERKMMSVLVETNSGYFVYAKGAPEIIMKRCTRILNQNQKISVFSKNTKRQILKINKQLNNQSLRTLAIAYKKLPGKKRTEYKEEGLVFIGLVAMEDPPREEVAEAISQARKAGIKIYMITGDHKDTAASIAKQIGITGSILTGKKLDKLNNKELISKLKDIAIFARVKPEHKLRIVRLLKKQGEIVTMTGDGVNDAPALKEAHIGVAMGIKGTDVSRSVADLTLKDDNFATIVSAVREGRTIFNNIRKFVSYQLSCNIAELLILFTGTLLAPLLGWQTPLLMALQILFMNLVTDNLPALTLAVNPSSQDIMNEPPRKKAEILNKPFIYLLVTNGIIMAMLTLTVYLISFNILQHHPAYARTVALATLILLEIGSAFNFRSYRKSVLGRSLFVNKYLVVASVFSLLLTLLIIYLPQLNQVFDTTPIDMLGWVMAVSSMLFIVILFDLLKFYSKRTKTLLYNLQST